MFSFQKGFFTDQFLRLRDKVILEEDEADNGEKVDEDDGQDGRQQDGPSVPHHRLHDVDQRLLSVDDVKEKDREEERMDAKAAEAKDEIDHVIAELGVG